MKEGRHRDDVYEKMAGCVVENKAKNHILPMSQFGILQMKRQRRQESLSSNLYIDCQYCRDAVSTRAPPPSRSSYSAASVW